MPLCIERERGLPLNEDRQRHLPKSPTKATVFYTDIYTHDVWVCHCASRGRESSPIMEMDSGIYKRALQKRRTNFPANGTHANASKETYKHQKRPTNEPLKEAYWHTCKWHTNKCIKRNLYTSKETHTRALQKRSNDVPVGSAPTNDMMCMYVHKRDLHVHKRDLYVHTRDLQKRRLYTWCDVGLFCRALL